jgi:hypothetical protein
MIARALGTTSARRIPGTGEAFLSIFSRSRFYHISMPHFQELSGYSFLPDL